MAFAFQPIPLGRIDPTMRSDMHKVVLERPRKNPGQRKHPRQITRDPDSLPKAEGMRRPHYHRKAVRELLGPLRRWLRARVGRPWNEVYSEACWVSDSRSVARAQVKYYLFGLFGFVHVETFLRNGEIWCRRMGTFLGPGFEGPIAEFATHWAPFYVDPCNGRLAEFPVKGRP